MENITSDFNIVKLAIQKARQEIMAQEDARIFAALDSGIFIWQDNEGVHIKINNIEINRINKDSPAIHVSNIRPELVHISITNCIIT